MHSKKVGSLQGFFLPDDWFQQKALRQLNRLFLQTQQRDFLLFPPTKLSALKWTTKSFTVFSLTSQNKEQQ